MHEVVRFARTARRHLVGRAHVLYVMERSEPHLVPATREDRSDEYLWVGLDDRGIELEVVAVERPDCLLVIHAMPTHYHRPRRSE